MTLTALAALGAALASPILDANIDQEGAAWVRTDRTVGWMTTARAGIEELGRAEGRVASVAWAPDAAAVMGRSGQWTLLVRGGGPSALQGPTGAGTGVAFADGGQAVIGIGADRAGPSSGSRDVGPALGPGTVWVHSRGTGETSSHVGDGSEATAVAGDLGALRYAAGFASGLVRVWPDGTGLQAGAPVQALDVDGSRLAVIAGGQLRVHGDHVAPVTVGDARAVHLAGDRALVHLDEAFVVVDLPTGSTERVEVKARAAGWLGGEPAWVLTEGSLVTEGSTTSLAAPGPDPHAPSR